MEDKINTGKVAGAMASFLVAAVCAVVAYTHYVFPLQPGRKAYVWVPMWRKIMFCMYDEMLAGLERAAIDADPNYSDGDISNNSRINKCRLNDPVFDKDLEKLTEFFVGKSTVSWSDFIYWLKKYKDLKK